MQRVLEVFHILVVEMFEGAVEVDVKGLKDGRQVVGEVQEVDVTLPTCLVEADGVVDVAAIEDKEATVLSCSSSRGSVWVEAMLQPPHRHELIRVAGVGDPSSEVWLRIMDVDPFLVKRLPWIQQKGRDRRVFNSNSQDSGDVDIVGQRCLRLDRGTSRSDSSNTMGG